MKSLEQALIDLQEIIDLKMKDYNIPEQKGNVVRLSHMIVRPSKAHGYIILDTKTNKSVAITFSKVAGIAVAKRHLNTKQFKDILQFDKIIEKNYNDSKFYYHNIKITADESRRITLESRLQIACEKIDVAKQRIDDTILCDMR